MIRQPWIAPALVAVSLLALIVSVASGIERSRYQHCQNRVIDALVRSQTARAAASEQDRAADRVGTEAEDNLWKAVNANQTLPPAEAKAKSQEAFQTFLSERARAEKMRQEAAADRSRHPLPDPPSERCD